MKVEMNDLKLQYSKMKSEIDNAIQGVINSSRFIGGEVVERFENEFSKFVTGEEGNCARRHCSDLEFHDAGGQRAGSRFHGRPVRYRRDRSER